MSETVLSNEAIDRLKSIAKQPGGREGGYSTNPLTSVFGASVRAELLSQGFIVEDGIDDVINTKGEYMYFKLTDLGEAYCKLAGIKP